MAQVKVFYEPERELLTVFWQQPRKNQIRTEKDTIQAYLETVPELNQDAESRYMEV